MLGDWILMEAQGEFRSHRRCFDQCLVFRLCEFKEEGEDIILGFLGWQGI